MENLKIFKLIFILIIIQVFKSQPEIKRIELNQTITGKMNLDDSYEYYFITLPPETEKNKDMLIVVISEDTKEIKEEEELFYDPDFHISKTEKYPSLKSSQWYCERYGSDILSIGSEYVGPNETFYIGIYCQFKCKYKFSLYLNKEAELEIAKIYTINLMKNSSLNYFMKIPDTDYEEFAIVANNINLNQFKIFVSKNSPSSQNTFEILPSWRGGYMISINKKSKHYCKNCSFHILLQSGNSSTKIMLYGYFIDKEMQLRSTFPFYDSIHFNSKRCYKFEFENDINFKDSKNNLIIQVTLFSGTVDLYIGGWKNILDVNGDQFYSKKNYSYFINGEKVVLLNKTDFDFFDSDYPINSNNTSKFLHFCLYAKVKSSYIISAHFLKEAENLQKYNYLNFGQLMTGHLEKGKVTSYQLLEYSQNSNITITLQNILGNSYLYSYFCYKEDHCYFQEKTIQDLLLKNSLITGTKKFNGQEIKIYDNDNICHKKFNNTEKMECMNKAIVYCKDSELCSYTIKATVNSSHILISPKTTYYNIIPKGYYDYYDIIIDDPKVKSLVIVLNTISGDAELYVYFNGLKGTRFYTYSLNDDYIPDVIRLTPSKLNRTNLINVYNVLVTAKAFSSYNLYYYTTTDQDFKKPNLSDVTLELTEGTIINDFFPKDIEYKIYSYKPRVNYKNEKEDIRIVLTRLGVPLSFFVYLKIEDFEYVEKTTYNDPEKFKGFIWKSDVNCELIISKKDPNYSLKGPYYILVSRQMNNNKNIVLDAKSIAEFYIGATRKNTPFLLKSGLQHSTTLTENYQKQEYLFTQPDIDKPFDLTINVFYGAIDIYVDVKNITEKSIEKNSVSFHKENVNNYERILINSDFLKRQCENYGDDNSCEIYIYIKKNKEAIDSNFIIVCKSDINHPEKLNPGIVRKERLWRGEERHYVIEEIQKRQGSSITITFYNGNGDIYLRIPKQYESNENIHFPTEKEYDYKGVDNFYGKSIKIPGEVFEKLENKNFKIQLLITVKNTKIGKIDYYSEFLLSYSGEAKRINQNVPYYNFIQSGESQYFTFYFDNKTNNIYISLSNMDGDADLYLNYGDTNYPIPAESDWHSSNTNHEFISITKNDDFFLSKKLNSVGGYYTLLIFGYTNTTYTLFVSGQDQVIMPLYDNSPLSCKCENNFDKCYFSYKDIFTPYENSNNNIGDIQVIFTTVYSYGIGMMYAKLGSIEKLYDQNSNISAKFPNRNNYDYSTIYSKQRNYMRFTFNSKNYDNNSAILLTLECLEPSLIDVNAASMRNFNFKSLDLNRENIFYLKKSDQETNFIFYHFSPKVLVYEIYPYLGKANLVVYMNQYIKNSSNSSLFTKVIKKFTEKKIESLEDFSDRKNASDNTLYGTVNYTNISKTQGEHIYFQITSKENFGFYIKLTYSEKWTRVPLSKSKDYLVQNKLMMGFFDVLNEYKNVEMNVLLKDHINKKAIIYVKLNILSKNSTSASNPISDEEAIYNYSVPNEKNYDYKAVSDKLLGSMLIRITNLPKLKEKYKFIRALFCVNISNESSLTDEMNEYGHQPFSSNDQSTLISILVTPSINYYKRLDASPYKYYFSNVSNSDNIDNNNKINEEVKIYTLEKVNKDDNILIIELSSCMGGYDFKIFDDLTLYDENVKSTIKYYEIKDHGRHIINVLNITSKHYYLSIKPKDEESLNCALYNENCSSTNSENKDSTYLMYYYTTHAKNYTQIISKNYIVYRNIGRGSIKIIIPFYKFLDINGEDVAKGNIKFSVIMSEDPLDFPKMESVCYLSFMLNKNDTLLYKNIKYQNNSIDIKGLKEDQKYFVNVLGENTLTKQLITFRPIEIITQNGGDVSVNITIILSIIILVAIIVLAFVVRKYKITKKILNYETYNQRNLSEINTTPTPTETELSTIVRNESEITYSNLNK